MIAILGGGITAIAAAIELQKRGKSFVLIEQSERLGGKIRSEKVKGYHLEFGPNTVLINHPETKAFLEYLNLYDKRIEPDQKAIKRRFVLKQAKIQPIPYNLRSLLKSKLVGLKSIASLIKEGFKKNKPNQKEESLAEFSKRRFGSQIYEDLITPFVSGIYAGDPEKMSLKYTMPMLYEAEDRFGSVIKGVPKLIKEKREKQQEFNMPKQKIFSFKGGLQMMIKEAEKKISNALRLNTTVSHIEQKGEKYLLRLIANEKEEDILVDKVISTIPGPSLNLGFDKVLNSAIKKINYVPALVCHLAYKPAQWNFKRGVFGLLSRKTESEPWLGILFNSEFFPQQQSNDDVLLTVIAGGYRQPDLLKMSDGEIIKTLEYSIRHIGLAEGKAVFHHLFRWKEAIPQYEVGYSEIVEKIEQFSTAHPNFKIAGNYYKGVSVSDCIANGTKLAREI